MIDCLITSFIILAFNHSFRRAARAGEEGDDGDDWEVVAGGRPGVSDPKGTVNRVNIVISWRPKGLVVFYGLFE